MKNPPEIPAPAPPDTKDGEASAASACSALRWDDPKWWPARCPECGWEGMSNETAGGNQIADTGDYDDPVCPRCIAPDGNHEHGRWVPVIDIPAPNAKGQPRLESHEKETK